MINPLFALFLPLRNYVFFYNNLRVLLLVCIDFQLSLFILLVQVLFCFLSHFQQFFFYVRGTCLTHFYTMKPCPYKIIVTEICRRKKVFSKLLDSKFLVYGKENIDENFYCNFLSLVESRFEYIVQCQIAKPLFMSKILYQTFEENLQTYFSNFG